MTVRNFLMINFGSACGIFFGTGLYHANWGMAAAAFAALVAGISADIALEKRARRP